MGRTGDFSLRGICRRLALAALMSLGAVPALAQPTNRLFSEIRVGLQAHDVPIFSTRVESGVDINGEVLFTSPDFLRILGRPRPHFGFSANTDGGMSQV